MPRAPNFTYQNPIGDIGTSLVQAILGNPEMAAKQRDMQAQASLREAQRQEAEAHGGLYTSQTTGQNTANTAQTSLPELFRQFALSNGPAPAPATVDSAGFGDFNAPFTPPVDTRPDHAISYANVIGAMAQMNGEHVDPTKTMGAWGAFGGDDELARRGLVAQGHSPTADFAITPGRADEIALNDAQQKQKQAWGVADRNHLTDIPVADIRRKSAFDVAGVNNRDDVPVAEIGARGKEPRGIRNRNPGNIEYGDFARSMGATGSDGRFAIFSTPEAGVRAQEALLSGSGYLGGGRNTINKIVSRYAPAGENSVSNYAGYISRVTGIDPDQPIGPEQIPAVAAAMRQFENGAYSGTAGKGGKSGAGAAPKPPKPPKLVSKAGLDLIDNELKTYGVNGKDTLDRSVEGYDPLDRVAIRADAVSIYQQTGNPAEAARKAVFNFAAKRRAQQGRSRPGDPGYAAPQAAQPARSAAAQPPVPGAKQAPDGKWYVQTGTKDGKPTYARVD